MQTYLGINNRDHFRKAFLKPLLDESGQLQMTRLYKPNSRNQKNVAVQHTDHQ